MRVKRAQTRAADNAANSDHEAGPAATASTTNSIPKPLKRPHSVQRDRLATAASSPAKTADSSVKKVANKSQQQTSESPCKPGPTGESDKTSESTVEPTGRNDGKKRARNNVEPTADTVKPLADGESGAQHTKESQDKIRTQSPVKQKATAKKPNPKSITTKKEPPKKGKKPIANKELKNLDIQLSGYSSVLNNDSMEASSDTNIKASISEIVKTKSRSSVSHSKAVVQIDKDKHTKSSETPVGSTVEESINPKIVTPKSPKETAKKATSPKATLVSKMSIAKRNNRPTGKKTKLQSELLGSVSDALAENEEVKTDGKNVEALKSSVETLEEDKKSEGTKAKPVFRSRAKNAKPKSVNDISSEEQNKTAEDSSKPSPKPRASKPPPANKRAQATKPKTTALRRKPNLPKSETVPSEPISVPPPSVWSLQVSDTLPFANSPSFSDPDTVTSPMIHADTSEPENQISGNSHIRKMVADILENLEMSDDVSGNEQSFPKGIATEIKAINTEPAEGKSSKITVKSIESMTVGETAFKAIEFEVKKDEVADDHISEDASKIEEATEASTTGTIECSTDATAGTSVEATPTKKPPPVKRKKPITQKQAKALKAKASSNPSKQHQQQDENASKDIYDFHESGHSSEDTSASYIKTLSKKGDDPEEPQTKSSKPVPKPSEETKKATIKTSPKKTANPIVDEPDVDDDDSSDSSDNKALVTKIPAKHSPKTSASDASSNSDSESGSDTSVRTRVNKRRKSAVKSRRLRLFGFYSGPKRHRMASLNALAKVQCLYENESRTAQELGFVREPRVAPRVRLAGCPDNTTRSAAALAASAKKLAVAEEKEATKLKKESEAIEAASSLVMEPEKKVEKAEGSKAVETEEKTTKPDETSSSSDESEEELKIDIDAPRTLRTVPGLRGAGKLWEMGNMSSFQSDSEPDGDGDYEQVFETVYSFINVY